MVSLAVVKRRRSRADPIAEADAELLRSAIAQSGLRQRDFALRVIAREVRSVQRYVTGRHKLPNVLRAFLVDYLASRARGSILDPPSKRKKVA